MGDGADGVDGAGDAGEANDAGDANGYYEGYHQGRQEADLGHDADRAANRDAAAGTSDSVLVLAEKVGELAQGIREQNVELRSAVDGLHRGRRIQWIALAAVVAVVVGGGINYTIDGQARCRATNETRAAVVEATGQTVAGLAHDFGKSASEAQRLARVAEGEASMTPGMQPQDCGLLF